MSPEAWQALADDLARIFLGWKLREDYPALLAIGEGSLRIDLRSGESWCDGEPLPTLFIAAELQSELEKASADTQPLGAAFVEAEFHTRARWHPDGERPFLEIACRVCLEVAGREVVAHASNQGAV